MKSSIHGRLLLSWGFRSARSKGCAFEGQGPFSSSHTPGGPLSKSRRAEMAGIAQAPVDLGSGCRVSSPDRGAQAGYGPLDNPVVPTIVDDIPDPAPGVVLAGELLLDVLDIAALQLPREVIYTQLAAVTDADIVERVMDGLHPNRNGFRVRADWLVMNSLSLQTIDNWCESHIIGAIPIDLARGSTRAYEYGKT
jgi:hypothetical protein